MRKPVQNRSINPNSPKRAVDHIAFAIATCGVGLMPFAPGTWGSAVGVGLFWLLNIASNRLFTLSGQHGILFASELLFRNSLLLILTGSVTFAGVWAATLVERRSRLKDPGHVVVDEVAGQLLAYIFIPLSFGPWTLLLGFLVFRLFDIWKPYPVKKLEALESGLGIMADDILAGFYAATVMLLLITLKILA